MSKVLVQDKKTQKRCHRKIGRGSIRTRVKLEFDLFTTKGYAPIKKDEVLLLDLLDQISRYSMEFHDVPGFQLKNYQAAGRRVV